MNPVLTLPFSEAAVVDELEKYFKKKEGYSILIPSSRQQRGFDLVLLNSKSKKSISLQVKGSQPCIQQTGILTCT